MRLRQLMFGRLRALVLASALVGCAPTTLAPPVLIPADATGTGVAIVHPAPAPPPSQPPPASQERDEYSVGDELMVTWEGQSYPATIIEVVARGHYRIHYDDYGDEWDEVIGPDRIDRRR